MKKDRNHSLARYADEDRKLTLAQYLDGSKTWRLVAIYNSQITSLTCNNSKWSILIEVEDQDALNWFYLQDLYLDESRLSATLNSEESIPAEIKEELHQASSYLLNQSNARRAVTTFILRQISRDKYLDKTERLAVLTKRQILADSSCEVAQVAFNLIDNLQEELSIAAAQDLYLTAKVCTAGN